MQARIEPLEVCPALASAFDLLGKRWTALILDVLASRPARFCELTRAIPGLSDRLLAERLKELTAAGLVRHKPAANASSVYELTETGHRLVPGFNAIREWAQAHHEPPA